MRIARLTVFQRLGERVQVSPYSFSFFAFRIHIFILGVRLSIHVEYFRGMHVQMGRTLHAGNYSCDKYTIKRKKNLKEHQEKIILKKGSQIYGCLCCLLHWHTNYSIKKFEYDENTRTGRVLDNTLPRIANRSILFLVFFLFFGLRADEQHNTCTSGATKKFIKFKCGVI